MALVSSGWRPPDEFDEFRIVRSLGIGAMGQVYLAHDLLLERPVAVKFVHATKDPVSRARVLEEARAIARLQHPNVVAIYRVADFEGHPYLVSEYVHGRALNQLERPMPGRQVLDIALDLTRGLAAAHRRGVLHRDVKPANAVLTDEGRAKLLDFGLAMVVDGGPGEDVAAATPPPTAPPRAAGLAFDANSTSQPTVPDPYVVGTPMYMAPEVWRGEPATRRSDLYSLGILLYELLAGAAPFRDVALVDLGNAVQQRDIPRLGEAAPGVDATLAAIVDRLVKRDPGDRYRSADELVVALEECASPSRLDGPADGNPYRGLAAFDSAHAPLFFGRRGEIRELVDRVRAEAFVVVGGDSGTGKSSLCRAGVLPWLANNDGWSCVEVVPGRHPVRAIAVALAPWTGITEAGLAEILRTSPDGAARAIRQNIVAGEGPPDKRLLAPRRLLLFVDQLEELLTLSEPVEAQQIAAALAALAVRSPWVRVLATARSDFLSRLAMLPGLGDEMARGLYFLRPLTAEHMREVIVRPAAAMGVVYESEALIDTLVAQTEHAPGGLPLLQFTLAELWDARDVNARTIQAESLAALGGVGGALTRHADRLLAGLGDDERDAARRILLRLVTAQRTRTRRSKAELLSDGEARDSEQAALEVLVRGRVLVANNAQDGAYEIAHEALLTSWSTLQAWLRRDAANHAIRERVEQAAAAWERMGRAPDLLWGRRQLAEARVLDRAVLAPREVSFLTTGAKAMQRRRVVVVGAATVLVVAAVTIGVAIRAKARRDFDLMIGAQIQAATTAQDSARDLAVRRDSARTRAFALFDAQRWADGEDAWSQIEALASREEHQYRTASAHLDGILLLDPARTGLREWAADLTRERLQRARRDRHRDLVDELESRLTAFDGPGQHAPTADARVQLTVMPPGTRVWLENPGVPRQQLGLAPLATLTLPPSSQVLAFEAPGYAVARLPILLEPGETLGLEVALRPASTAPAGMIYVPPGQFLFGSADSSDLRRGFLSAAPLHEVSTPGYFIARYEVTFAEWIAYLEDLSPEERRHRALVAVNMEASLTLTELGPHHWRFSLTPTARTYTAETGQRLRYEKRSSRIEQDWTKFPVSGVSYDDAMAYAAWLDRTGRIPGARLCNEYEWERAARGADGRTFPSGELLAPDDANIDVTYGREPLAFGPDEVGLHPGSRSPVGADDMAGNVWEWVASVQAKDAPITRGGSWYQGDLSARSNNRAFTERTLHHPFIGVRLCATPR